MSQILPDKDEIRRDEVHLLHQVLNSMHPEVVNQGEGQPVVSQDAKQLLSHPSDVQLEVPSKRE